MAPTALLALLLVPYVTYAVGDSFNVSTTIGSDTTPPSVPANLSATPVATTQINLSWTASTDDFAVSGYQIFRDGTQIATTTTTSYSDTGLTEATLYTYYVTAFDSSDLISASSTQVSTTTLSTSPPVEEEEQSTGGVSGGAAPPEIVWIEVIPGTTFAVINWKTSGYVRGVVRFGNTTSYELGSIAEQNFLIDHSTLISGLQPNTRYYFSIGGKNGVGGEKILIESSFKTVAAPDVFPPSNVFNLHAEKIGDDVKLTWENPHEPDFNHVRVLRSDRFYPNDPVDGMFVYEGSDTETLDIGAAVPNSTQYYTVFSYDNLGNISSGAIIAISFDANGEIVPFSTDTIPLSEETLDISIGDLIFEQDGKKLEPKDGKVDIDGGKGLSISLPVDAVPERLKSIVVTVYKDAQSGLSFSFLLRINEDRTRYTASVAPFGISGEFPLAVSVFDYGIRKVAQLKATIISNIVQSSTDTRGFLQRGYLLYFLLFLIAMLAIAWMFFRRYWHAGRDKNVTPVLKL